MIIKYNNNTIYDWNFGASNIIKVYRNNAVVYYKIDTSGDTPTYKVCYAVVYDISQYQETEFTDVYDKATSKWYKLNNLNQYEQYGVYGSSTGASVTTYDGKLAIDNGYEYQYGNGQWNNVGEVSASTASLPNVPFSVNYNAKNYDSSTKTLLKTEGQLVDIDAVITAGTPTVNDGYLTITSGTRATISGYATYFNRTSSAPNMTIISKQRTDGSNCHMFTNRDSNYNWMYRVYSTKLTLHGGSETGSITVTSQPVIESVRVNSTSPMLTYNNYTDSTSSTTNSFSYGSTNSGNFVMFQGLSSESFIGDFYWVYMSQNTLTDEQVQQVIDYNETFSVAVYPLYYTEKADPPNNLAFSSIEDADAYAYNNCVYDGEIATIDGEKYSFDSDEGWVSVPCYYRVEDVTPNGTSGWTVTDSDTYNPDKGYYDDFDIETTSASENKVAKVTIFGYENFTYYLRSSGYSNYCYVTSTNLDELQSDPISMNYNNSSAITHTYDWNKPPKADVNLSNYRRITYNNLNKTVEHTFYVVFKGNYYPSNATILIPKDQSQEKWEQIVFSSSTITSGTSKELYIDGDYSSSGGTSKFYRRWMVGLPSGSHSSYVSLHSYYYCPSVTSSTFTSVGGGVREVDYSYTAVPTKTLSFRLVDNSGNTITSTDKIIYYNMVKFNGCNSVITRINNLTFPRSNEMVAVGGGFYFIDSSNRHYIYGYEPNIQMNTNFYTDNYTTYFDIPYTKLDTEVVTITYTTFDPNDTETPIFSTEVSYPYGNSGTSATTLSSYEVPYTYSYTIKQTNNLLSTVPESFTASEPARAISFTLYPNNREFSTVADMEAYAYAWEGMIAYVDDTTYKYENGEWFERFIPYTYEELSYFTVPKVLCTSSNYFAIKNNLNSNYIYTYQFTPNNGFYNSYYGCITSNDNHNVFKNYGIFKLDNGWGTESERSILALYNYKFDTRRSSHGGNIPSAFRFYVGAKATVIMKLHNPSDTTQGADLTVQNDGYTTVTETSTTLLNSSLTVVEGEYDMPLFSTTSNNCYTPQISFHNFKVEDNDGNLIYDYRPVKRILDGTIGLYDTVNQQFFYPSGYTFTT